MAKADKGMALGALVVDERCQAREERDAETVREYSRLYSEGEELPPIEVFQVDDDLVVIDGFHRIEAARRARLAKLPVKVTGTGTIEDAQWAAVSKNAKHGRRRTRADIERAVRMTLAHPASKGLSNRELAKHLGVSHTTIANYKDGGRRGTQIELPRPKVNIADLLQEADGRFADGNFGGARVIYESAIDLAPVEEKAQIRESLRLCDEAEAPEKRAARITYSIQTSEPFDAGGNEWRLEVHQLRCSLCGLAARTRLSMGWTKVDLCAGCVEDLQRCVPHGPVQQSGIPCSAPTEVLIEQEWPDAVAALIAFVARDEHAGFAEAAE
jgi:transcriptional regulator with XRE-family HTH domain